MLALILMSLLASSGALCESDQTLKAYTSADLVVVAEVVELGESVGIWSGVFSTGQRAHFRVQKVLRGKVKSKDLDVVFFLGKLATNSSGKVALSEEYFEKGRTLLLMLKKEKGEPFEAPELFIPFPDSPGPKFIGTACGVLLADSLEAAPFIKGIVEPWANAGVAPESWLEGIKFEMVSQQPWEGEPGSDFIGRGVAVRMRLSNNSGQNIQFLALFDDVEPIGLQYGRRTGGQEWTDPPEDWREMERFSDDSFEWRDLPVDAAVEFVRVPYIIPNQEIAFTAWVRLNERSEPVVLASESFTIWNWPGQSKKEAAIGLVREFVARRGYSEVASKHLTAGIVKHAALPEVELYQVTNEGLTVDLGEGRLLFSSVSHPSRWLIAFVGERSFKLAGFESESEFLDLVQTQGMKIASRDDALQQVQLYFDLVRGEQPEIVGSEKEVASAVQQSFDWAGRDAGRKGKGWAKGVPDFVWKRLHPPLVYQSASGFTVELFGIVDEQGPRLVRFSFLVVRDGRVIPTQTLRLNVPYFEP